MENSVANSMNTSPSSSSNINQQTTDDHDHSPEESSWTFYIQDFLCGNNRDISLYPGCDQETTTADHVVSDAFSSAGRKVCDNNNIIGAAAFTSSRSNCKQLSFKRRKPNIIGASTTDHDLEDTATSPAHSPKVSHINQQLNFNQSEKDHINVSEGNNIGRRDTTHEVNVVGVADHEEENNEHGRHSELKKKGLCLVPVSMLRDYFG